MNNTRVFRLLFMVGPFLVLFSSFLLAGNIQQGAPQTGPHIYLQNSHDLAAVFAGKESVTDALNRGSAQPLALAPGDVNEDGIADLVVGYDAGVVAVFKGNLDAFAPQSSESFRAIANDQFPSPFLASAEVMAVPVRPDFVALANLEGDAHQDLIVGQRGGDALYVFPGDGTGKFGEPRVSKLGGALTAMLTGTIGSGQQFERLLVGTTTTDASGVLLFSGSKDGLSLTASYAVQGAVSAFAFGDLDRDTSPDAAMVAGGRVFILHGRALDAGKNGRLTPVPLPFTVSAIALGKFVHDRDSRLQMALLSTDGSLNIVAHSAFDPRSVTRNEIKAMKQERLRARLSGAGPQRAQAASTTGWQVIETFAGVAPYGDANSLPIIMRTRISGRATDDALILNPGARQLVVVSHPTVKQGTESQSSTFVAGSPTVITYDAGVAVGAVAMRVNIDARPGLVVIHRDKVVPATMMPLPDPTFIVNTTADSVDDYPGDGVCADFLGFCSLRAAVMEANATLGNDTIMLPPGIYTLSLVGANENDASTGDLDITDGVNIVGLDKNTTIVQAGTGAGTGIDKVFSINPYFNTAFDTSISNLTIRFGRNPSLISGDGYGGALDWEASGTGTLHLTNVVISDNATTDGDGGGISLSNIMGGPGVATLSNCTINNNSAVESSTGNGGVGGGVDVFPSTPVDISNSQITNNRANQSLGYGGGVYFSDPSGLPQSVIHNTSITGNQAGVDGGGIYTNRGILVDQGSTISNNVAGRSGGGIFSNVANGFTTLSKVTLTGNSAGSTGGGIQADALSAAGGLSISYSRIVGNTASAGTGLATSSGTITATQNWWGCSGGPAASACDHVSGSATFSPYLVLNHVATTPTLNLGGVTPLVAGFTLNSAGATVLPADLTALIGLPITFNNAVNGSISSPDSNIGANGTAGATFLATTAGTAKANAVVDNATVTALITVNAPDLTVTSSHSGSFTQGQTGVTYTITVSNIGPGTTLNTVSVTDVLPAGLTATSMTGAGWTCDVGAFTCSRTDTLAASGAYPPITVTVDVANNAPASVMNTVVVSGGGELNAANDSTGDLTTIIQKADLTVTKSHTGNFTQGQTGATYSITVTNSGGGATAGTVTAVDTLPAGLSATAISGPGWTCGLGTLSCSRSDVLTGGASYPVITVTVDVASSVPASLTNSVSVSGGGELNAANNTASDATTITQVPDLTITESHIGNFTQGQSGAAYTLTVSNVGPGSTVGSVTVNVNNPLATGLSAASLSGTGWACNLGTLSCSRSSVLAAGASYPAITLAVNVANNAPAAATTIATVSGGGELNTANNNASDSTTIVQLADLTVASSHSGNFTQGQSGAYTLAVSNIGMGDTSGVVTVVNTLPVGLSATSMSGAGWTCDVATHTCTRNDVLTSGASYPVITLAVNVAGNATVSLSNTATVSGGGEIITSNDTSNDATTIVQVPTTVTATLGTPQSATINAAFATLLKVVVQDAGGVGVPNASVAFTAPATGASASFGPGPSVTVAADASGIATAPAITANSVAGSYSITATVSGVATPGTFALTNQPGAASSLTATSGAAQSATTNTAFGSPMQVVVKDVGGNPVPNVTVTFTAPASGASVTFASTGTNTATAVTDSVGVAISPLVTANGTAGGPYTVVASTAGAGIANLQLTNVPPTVQVTVTTAPSGLPFTVDGTTYTSSQTITMDVGSSHTIATSSLQPGVAGTQYVFNTWSDGGVLSHSFTVSSTATAYTANFDTQYQLSITASPIAGGTTAPVTGASFQFHNAGSVVPVSATANSGYAFASWSGGVASASAASTTVTMNQPQALVANFTALADLAIITTHVGNFNQGQNGAAYMITVNNLGPGPSAGVVTMTDALPVGLTATSLSGAGWACNLATLSCTRNDALAVGASYPVITVLVNVANNAPASGTNTASVTGGGDFNAANNSSSDSTSITSVADLTISKSHSGNFRQAQNGAVFTIGVSNAGAGPTTGTVSMVDSLPQGFTAVAMNGSGWNCDLSTVTCTRGDTLAAGASYPAITLMVNVSPAAPASLTNTAAVSGGGEVTTANDTATDTVVVTPISDVAIAMSHSGAFSQTGTGSYTLAVSNVGAGPTIGTVTVVVALPKELTATAIAGTGWNCTLTNLTCTRNDVLNAGASYPAITMSVNVAGDAPASLTSTATVSGGGELNTSNSIASDVTAIASALTMSAVNSSAAILQGGTAIFTLKVTAAAGASVGNVVFACSSLPVGMSCQFTPSPTNQFPANVSMTVITSGGQILAKNGASPLEKLSSLYAVMMLPLMGIVQASAGRNRKKALKVLLLIMMLVAVLAMGACGGGHSGPQRTVTPVGTYNITVTATGSGAQAQTIVSLTVK